MTKVTVGNLTSVESKYEWEIPNFRSYAGYENGQCLCLPYFSTHCKFENSSNSMMELKWFLKIYPSGKDKPDNEFISIYLVNCNEFKVTTKYSIKMGVDGSSILKGVSQQKIFDTEDQCGRGYNQFVDKELVYTEHSNYLLNDTLTISCSVFETCLSIGNQESSKDIHLEALNCFENLLESGKFSDVTFNIGEKKIQVHRGILSTASVVFQAMFDYEMTEQKDGIVNIVDIEFDIMKEMFRYIYARKVNGIDKIVCDLLIAADKYCINGLKELCEKTLCKKLTVDNALQYLELSVEYNATKLKTKTLEFAVKKLKNIVKSEEFQSLSSELKSELLLHIACNQ